MTVKGRLGGLGTSRTPRPGPSAASCVTRQGAYAPPRPCRLASPCRPLPAPTRLTTPDTSNVAGTVGSSLPRPARAGHATGPRRLPSLSFDPYQPPAPGRGVGSLALTTKSPVRECAGIIAERKPVDGSYRSAALKLPPAQHLSHRSRRPEQRSPHRCHMVYNDSQRGRPRPGGRCHCRCDSYKTLQDVGWETAAEDR